MINANQRENVIKVSNVFDIGKGKCKQQLNQPSLVRTQTRKFSTPQIQRYHQPPRQAREKNGQSIDMT